MSVDRVGEPFCLRHFGLSSRIMRCRPYLSSLFFTHLQFLASKPRDREREREGGRDGERQDCRTKPLHTYYNKQKNSHSALYYSSMLLLPFPHNYEGKTWAISPSCYDVILEGGKIYGKLSFVWTFSKYEEGPFVGISFLPILYVWNNIWEYVQKMNVAKRALSVYLFGVIMNFSVHCVHAYTPLCYQS